MKSKTAGHSADSLYITLMLAFLISIVALSFNLISPSGFAVSESAGNSFDVLNSGGHIVSGSAGQFEAYGSPAGRVEGTSGYFEIGSAYYFSETGGPTFSNLRQSTSTPAVNAPVQASTTIFSDAGLSSAVFYSNETGNFVVGETKTISGSEANVSFTWSKNIPTGTAVAWKIVAEDIAGTSTESQQITFVVGATDLEPPKILSASMSPENPGVGNIITFSADVSDDFGLASAVLEINGRNSGAVNLAGRTGKAEIPYTPIEKAGEQISWKIIVKDSTGKETSTQAKTFSLAAAPAALTCKDSEKPPTGQSACANGKRSITEPSCEPSSGKWKKQTREVPCSQNETETDSGKPPTVETMIALAAAIIIASTIYLYKKYPEKFREFFDKIKDFFKPKKSASAAQSKPAEKISEKIPASSIVVKSLKVPKKRKDEEEE